MNLKSLFEFSLFLMLISFIAPFLGNYIYKVMENKKTFFSFILKPIEKILYKFFKIDPFKEYDWKGYLKNILIFSLSCFIFTFLIIQFQAYLPLNPQKLKAPSLDLTFNIVVSFLTNTNFQSYTPETTLSYFSQMTALTLQNFLSPAIGFGTALVLIRALVNNKSNLLGNFYRDLIKFCLYVLLPISTFLAILFVINGIPQNFNEYKEIISLEGHKQMIIGGPIASQEAIKILGTNGGGFTLANSSHPFENPNFITNFLQMFMILLIPASQFFYFGRVIKDKRHCNSIFITMVIFFVISYVLCYFFDIHQTPTFQDNKIISHIGNFEGKEVRFGEANSILYTVATTTASNGATNCSLDSLEPISGLIPMLNIQLGEIIFGGIGSGLYSILLFVFLSIFISGLIIGRTPEYLGKKIEIKEMKLLLFGILIFFFLILTFSAISSVMPIAKESIKNKGPHGLSEILYIYSTSVANNGSSFSGLNANTLWYNLSTGFCMLLGRYELIIFIVALSGSLAIKKKVMSEGAFPISGVIFISVLFVTILVIGVMTFLPAIVMGPILEKFYLMQKTFF